MKICLRCGEPCADSYCDEHLPEVKREQRPAKKFTAEQKGYDSRWRRLSRKARRMQPFCTDCGATENLELDHTPETWQRHRDRKPIRLEHTGGVVCGDCNRKRGDARGGGRGYTWPQDHPGAQGTETVTHNYAERRISMQKEVEQ